MAPAGAFFRTGARKVAADDASRSVSYVFSTGAVARDGHRILAGGWDTENFSKNPVFCWAHDTDQPPIGRVTSIGEAAGVLRGTVQYAETPFADTIYKLVRGGFLNATSVSWLALQWAYAREAGRPQGAIDFSKVELLEVSQVCVPALPAALADARSAGVNTLPLAAWAERQLETRNFAAMGRPDLEELRRAAHAADLRRRAYPSHGRAIEARPARFESFGAQMRAIAQAATGRDPDERLVRAPATASEGEPTAGGFLVEEQFTTDLIGSLYEENPIAPLCDYRETAKPLAGQKLPAIDETSRADGSRWGGVSTYWESEAETATGSFPRFRAIEFAAKKLMSVAIVTNELVEDVPLLDGHLRRAFAAEMGFKLDAAILKGTGAGQPLGILNSPALIVVPKQTGQASGVPVEENINTMWSALPAPSRRRAVWLMNEDILAQLDSSTTFTGIYQPAGSAGNPTPLLKGRPAIEIEQASPMGTFGDFVLADLSQYILISGGLRMALSAHVEFLNYQTVFRFTLRIDGKGAWASQIASYNGTSQRSPFVALAARP